MEYIPTLHAQLQLERGLLNKFIDVNLSPFISAHVRLILKRNRCILSQKGSLAKRKSGVNPAQTRYCNRKKSCGIHCKKREGFYEQGNGSQETPQQNRHDCLAIGRKMQMIAAEHTDARSLLRIFPKLREFHASFTQNSKGDAK